MSFLFMRTSPVWAATIGPIAISLNYPLRNIVSGLSPHLLRLRQRERSCGTTAYGDAT